MAKSSVKPSKSQTSPRSDGQFSEVTLDHLVLQIDALYIPEEDPVEHFVKVNFMEQILLMAAIKPFGIADRANLQHKRELAKGFLGYDPSNYRQLCAFADSPLTVTINKEAFSDQFMFNANSPKTNSDSPTSLWRNKQDMHTQNVTMALAHANAQVAGPSVPPTQRSARQTALPELGDTTYCCNIDILPLFLDQDSICVKKRLQPMWKPRPSAQKSWDNLPLIIMSITACRDKENANHHRLLTEAIAFKMTIIGAYNLITPFNNKCYYTAATKLPMYNDENPTESTRMVMYEEGFPAPRHKFSCKNFYPAWEELRSLGEPFIAADDKLEFTLEDVFNPGQIDLQQYLDHEYFTNNVIWASSRRTLLLEDMVDSMRRQLIEWLWPVEVHFYGDGIGGCSFMGFMDLFNLLYPGKTKLTVAVPLEFFNMEMMAHHCNCSPLLLPNENTCTQFLLQGKDQPNSEGGTPPQRLLKTGGDGQTAFVLVQVEMSRPFTAEAIPPYINNSELKAMLEAMEPLRGSRPCVGRGQQSDANWCATVQMAANSLKRVPQHGLPDICRLNRQLAESRTRIELFTSFVLETALYVNNTFNVQQYLQTEESFQELVKITHLSLMRSTSHYLLADTPSKLDPVLRAARHARHMNDIQHASELYLQVVVQSPFEPNYWRELSTCLKGVDREWAAVCVNKSLLLNMRHPLTIISKGCMVFETDPDGAEPFFTFLLALCPLWPLAYLICEAYFYSRELFKMADALKESSKLITQQGLMREENLPQGWERELGDFWEQTAFLPGMSAYYRAADLLLRLRAISLAEICLRLSRLESGETAAYLHLVAMCTRLRGDFTNAICFVQKAMTQFGEDTPLLCLEAECRYYLGDTSGAMSLFAKSRTGSNLYTSLLSLPCWDSAQKRIILVDILRRQPNAYGWMAFGNYWLQRAEDERQVEEEAAAAPPSTDTKAKPVICAAACAVQALKFDRRCGRAWALLSKLVQPHARRMFCANMAAECGYKWTEETSIDDLSKRTQKPVCYKLADVFSKCKCQMEELFYNHSVSLHF